MKISQWYGGYTPIQLPLYYQNLERSYMGSLIWETEIYWIMEGGRRDRAAISEKYADYNTAIFWLRWKAETLQTLLGVYSVNFFTWSIVKYQIYKMRVGGKSYIILMWSNATTKFLSTTRERTNGTNKMDVPFLTFVQGQPGVALNSPTSRRVAVLLLKQADTGKSQFASRRLQDASQPLWRQD